MRRIIFTEGMQGSGKTTWAKKYCEDHPEFVRISRDDLRHMRGKYWMPKREGFITEWEYALIAVALKRNYNIVIDEMNLNKSSVDAVKKFCKAIVKEEELEFLTRSFKDVSLETCIERDRIRPNSIGEKVLRNTYKKYLAPKIKKYKAKKSLPHAIIVDLDGTLALFGDKNPYERDFINDEINEPLLQIIKSYLSSDPTKKLIIFSGRSDRFKNETKEWLTKHGIKPHIFQMRTELEEKAQIKDVIVKEKMFENYVRDKFNIDFVLDDRDQVVELWRSLGLTCLQVADGDF